MPEGKKILKQLGIEGDYEGIGHCILGYTDGDMPKPHKRKDSYVYKIKISYKRLHIHSVFMDNSILNTVYFYVQFCHLCIINLL